MNAVQLGPVGIWSMELRFGDKGEAAECAAELDELGFGALWIPGGIDDAVLGDVDAYLAVSKRLAIGTGIINMWKQKPADIAAWWKTLPADKQSRVMLGLGVSHGPIIGDAWKKPMALARDFLDEIAAAGLPPEAMCLAALGPKMVALSGERTAGAHPYLTTPEHTATARKILGPGKLLAPEQGVVLESDPAKARQMAVEALDHYRNLPNYRNNWLRIGFSQADIDTLSDRLIDGLFAWGGMDKIVERVKAHHDAGANHVCLQVIRGAMGCDIAGLRAASLELADALL